MQSGTCTVPTSLSHCVRFTREGHDEVVLKTRWELHQLEQAQRSKLDEGEGWGLAERRGGLRSVEYTLH